jgi:MFS family permease
VLVPALALLRSKPEAYGMGPDGVVLAVDRDGPKHKEVRPTEAYEDMPLSETAPSPQQTDGGSMTLSATVRTPCFWSVVLAHSSIEFLWCGTQLFLVQMLAEHGLSARQAGMAQAVGSVAAVVATLCAGVCIDRVHAAHAKRWVLVAATAIGAFAALALLYSKTAFLACAATGLMGAMMGPLDVVISTLYAALFGRAHLGSILGLVGTLTYLSIGASPVVFGLVHSGTHSFGPLLRALALWMPLAATALALAPPPDQPLGAWSKNSICSRCTRRGAAMVTIPASLSGVQMPSSRGMHQSSWTRMESQSYRSGEASTASSA